MEIVRELESLGTKETGVVNAYQRPTIVDCGELLDESEK